jgi:hypothetical protein
VKRKPRGRAASLFHSGVLPVDYHYVEKEAAALKQRFNEIFQ